MREYEVTLLAFGAGLGIAWAAVALFIVTRLSDSISAAASYTILLPITAAFLLATRLPVPDLVFTCFAVAAIGGVIVAFGAVVYWRVRDG